MFIGASEGCGFRYEVFERPDGYLVHMRDVDTGTLDETDAMVFRTAPVAFRYAQMLAAFDRLAAARISGEATEDHQTDLEEVQAFYNGLSDRLSDEGVAAHMLAAWDLQYSASERSRYH